MFFFLFDDEPGRIEGMRAAAEAKPPAIVKPAEHPIIPGVLPPKPAPKPGDREADPIPASPTPARLMLYRDRLAARAKATVPTLPPSAGEAERLIRTRNAMFHELTGGVAGTGPLGRYYIPTDEEFLHLEGVAEQALRGK